MDPGKKRVLLEYLFGQSKTENEGRPCKKTFFLMSSEAHLLKNRQKTEYYSDTNKHILTYLKENLLFWKCRLRQNYVHQVKQSEQPQAFQINSEAIINIFFMNSG